MEASIGMKVVLKVYSSWNATLVEVIVGDNDSSAIAHVHETLDSNVQKSSDCNHLKTPLENELYSL